MEESDQKKYLKCKYKVKKWESEFKNINGANPSKTDIRNAPTRIKDAYRTYWKLKTLSLETSLVEVSFGDEDSMDFGSMISADTTFEGTNKSALKSEGESEAEKTDVPVHANVGEYETKEDDKHCNLKNVQTNNDDTGTQYKLEVKEKNDNSIWGAHLSNASKKVEKTLDTPKTDISFRFTAKLFPGATFKKRNPRKALVRREKSVDTSVSLIEDGQQPLESDLSQKDSEEGTNSFENNTVLNEEFPIADIGSQSFNNFKYKVVSDSQPSKLCQPVSLLHKTLLTNSSTKSLGSRVVDKGWLERLEKVTNIDQSKINSSDSGIELTDSSVFEPRSSPSQGHQLEITSDDEDLVCDSGSEDEKSKSFNSNFSFKRSFSFSKVSNGFSSSFKRASLSFTSISNIGNGQHKQKAEKRAIESEFDDGGIDCDSTDNRPNKILKVDLESSSVNHNKTIDNKCETEYSLLHNSSATKTPEQKKLNTSTNRLTEIQNKSLSAKEIKLQEILKSKVNSGKLNENFIKINIKKKNFVRGKKTMTFQKYKKQKWKEMKKNQSTSEKGVLKCFKCGDVGHFSRNCLKACDQLLPVEDLDEVEESPFPTLQEAEEMAVEASKSMCVRRNLVSLPAHVTNEAVTDENHQPPPIDNDDIMRFVNREPIFKLNEDGSLIDTPLAVLNALIECGHDSFRPGQEVTVMRVLSGLSTLVTLSTGSGKSLCYQLPAYLYHTLQQRITLVISPLVSLMEDQVFGLAPCLRVACLHTNQTPQVRAAVYEQLRANTLHALLVSPEALSETEKVLELLRSMPPVAFACIDEAHCISQWSHNFRPSYLTICQVLREKFGVKTFLGLTATATKATIVSVSEALGLPDGVSGVVRDTPLPDNLLLTVSRDPAKDQALIRLLQGRRFSECHSIIVYCTRRDECQRLAAFIRTCLQDVSREDGKVKRGKISWNAETYHAGLTAGRRRAVQKAFMSGQTRIVVATVAFGMGINKQDIRGIIHYNMPSAFERYVQEVGRAGRDGEVAHCHLFLDTHGKDLSELRRHVYSDSVERHTIRKLLQRVFVPCQCGTVCPGHEVALPLDDTVKALDLPEEHISTLLCYLQLDRRGWLKVCPRAYTRCRVLCYKGAATLRRAAKECPPLAVAIAQQAQTGVDMKRVTSLDFSVFSVAAAINWDTGVVKRVLKNLEWTKVNGIPCRSGIKVELYELGMRLMSPGNLSPEELDCALNTLTSRVEAQESQALRQLQAIFNVLKQVSYPTVEECMDEVDRDRCESLKTNIRQYFTEDKYLDNHQLPEVSLINEDQVTGDVRALVNSYRDVTFTGRAVARIFHGIQSPNYPAQQWFRCRFWRTHLHEDFNLLCRLATRELIKMR